MAPYDDLLELVEELWGATGRAALDQAARFRLAGLRLSVPVRPPTPSAAQVEAAAPGRPERAAQRLGISRATAYRVLQRRRLVR